MGKGSRTLKPKPVLGRTIEMVSDAAFVYFGGGTMLFFMGVQHRLVHVQCAKEVDPRDETVLAGPPANRRRETPGKRAHGGRTRTVLIPEVETNRRDRSNDSRQSCYIASAFSKIFSSVA